MNSLADFRRCNPEPEQKSEAGNEGYLQPPLFTFGNPNPAFQLPSFGKHDGVGGVMCVALLKLDGKVTEKP